MKIRKKKQALTLLEIMVVIVLIGLIGSVIGFNMKGSLDEGRAFKTRQAQSQIHDILMLEVALGTPIEEVLKNPRQYLANSGLVKDPDKLLKDGWEQPFDIKQVVSGGHAQDDIKVTSAKLDKYEDHKKDKLKSATQNSTPAPTPTN